MSAPIHSRRAGVVRLHPLVSRRYFLVKATHGEPGRRRQKNGVAAHLAISFDAMHQPICGGRLGDYGWECFGDTEWPMEAGSMKLLCERCAKAANVRISNDAP